jgi:hypothetical protein
VAAPARDLHDAAVLERVDGDRPMLVARVAQPELPVLAAAPTVHRCGGSKHAHHDARRQPPSCTNTNSPKTAIYLSSCSSDPVSRRLRMRMNAPAGGWKAGRWKETRPRGGRTAGRRAEERQATVAGAGLAWRLGRGRRTRWEAVGRARGAGRSGRRCRRRLSASVSLSLSLAWEPTRWCCFVVGRV